MHIGDIGTQYQMRVLRDGLDFDPTDAVVKRLFFLLPGNHVLSRDATQEDDGGSPPAIWYLTYTVVAGDVGGSPSDDMHGEVGRMKVQGYLEYADGRVFRTDVVEEDTDGRELRVRDNLA